MQCSIQELRDAGRAMTETRLGELFQLFVSNMHGYVTDSMCDPSKSERELVKLQMQGHTVLQFAQTLELLAELPTMGKTQLVELMQGAGVTFTDEEDDNG